MIRKIITIDEDKCTGCGLCAEACHESAIGMVDGKARLLRDDFCDGLGDCLPACPADAISFTEREAAAYDEAAVLQSKQAASAANMANTAAAAAATAPASEPAPSGCPGSRARAIAHAEAASAVAPATTTQPEATTAAPTSAPVPSMLTNWPVQIKLAPTSAPYFDGANLLIAADCCAYSYGNFHADFMRNKTCLIGCPKLDAIDYAEKLTAIIAGNDVKNVTICRMEVPCCGGLENMAKRALQQSGKFIPWQVVTFSLDGRILD